MFFRKEYIGWYLMVLLSLFPLVLWARIIAPLSLRFFNFNATLTSIGQMAGLTGMAMFSLTLFLSSRTPKLEDIFGGLNKIYVAHHLFGGISFILLMAHPLLFAISSVPVSYKLAASFLIPGDNWQYNLGMAALITMMLLLILTFFTTLPYHIWKLSHKFLGAAFFLGALHAFFIPSDISRDPILRSYMLILIGIGLSSVIYRTLLHRWLVYKHVFTVTTVKKLKPNVVEIVFEPVRSKLDFEPGQFVFVSFKSAKLGEDHPFSISSPPNQNSLSLTLKSLGDFTERVKDVTPGTQALIEGPYGRFSSQRIKNKNQLWVGGGIGVTPFMSMARCLNDPDFHIDLCYAVRDPTEAIYLEELQLLAKQNPQFRIHPYYSGIQGRLTGETLSQMIPEIDKKDVFLCGPPPMMYALKNQLKKFGLRGTRIHSEEFQMLT